MRIIHVDVSPILPTFNTATSSFATWVKIPKRLVPEELHIVSTEVIGLKFTYSEDCKSLASAMVAGTRVHLGGACQLVGFDIPVHNFQSELRNLIAWLRQEGDRINVEMVRLNWQFVTAI